MSRKTPQTALKTVRFTPGLAAAARNLASHDGVTFSAWIRRVTEREIIRRDAEELDPSDAYSRGLRDGAAAERDRITRLLTALTGAISEDAS